MIKNIVFDMGGVLIRFDREAFLDRHAPGASREERTLLCREIYLSADWIMQDRGTRTPEQTVQVLCERLPEKLHASAKGLITRWYEDMLPVEGMEEVVRSLKEKGYGIYLLSNAALDQPDYWPLIPGSSCFDDVCVSAFEGALKPELALYERAFAKFGIEPCESLFIDDMPANIEAACRAGMQGIVFHGDVRELKEKMRALGVEI